LRVCQLRHLARFFRYGDRRSALSIHVLTVINNVNAEVVVDRGRITPGKKDGQRTPTCRRPPPPRVAIDNGNGGGPTTTRPPLGGEEIVVVKAYLIADFKSSVSSKRDDVLADRRTNYRCETFELYSCPAKNLRSARIVLRASPEIFALEPDFRLPSRSKILSCWQLLDAIPKDDC